MGKYLNYLRVVLIVVIILAISIPSFLAGYFMNLKDRLEGLQRPAQKTATIKRDPLKIRAAIPYWDQENAYSSFEENVDKIDYVSLFWYYMDSKGNVIKYKDANEDRDIINFAHANNVKVIAVITNLPETEGSDWDAKRVERVIGDKSLRRTHIQNISKKLDDLNFDGVSIDYEEIYDTKQKDNFTLFIKELSEELHKKDEIVEVALHPKSAEAKPSESNGSQSQDWKQLAKYSDHLYIMAYGEHWDGSSPGPIASSPWVEKIIDYTKKLNLDTKKMYLGIPMYGEKWKNSSGDNKDHTSTSEGLTYTDIKTLIAEHDIQDIEWSNKAKSPHFYYEDEDDSYEVWFEDARSIKEKALLAYNAGFSGITFWRLGGEDERVWEEIGEL